jgi:hypothetical protein
MFSVSAGGVVGEATGLPGVGEAPEPPGCVTGEVTGSAEGVGAGIAAADETALASVGITVAVLIYSPK